MCCRHAVHKNSDMLQNLTALNKKNMSEYKNIKIVFLFLFWNTTRHPVQLFLRYKRGFLGENRLSWLHGGVCSPLVEIRRRCCEVTMILSNKTQSSVWPEICYTGTKWYSWLAVSAWISSKYLRSLWPRLTATSMRLSVSVTIFQG